MKLWAHQQKAVELARTEKNLALFLETGTGKTATMIHILREEYNREKRIVPTLIFTPLPVCAQWKREFARFSQVPPEKIHVLTGGGAKRVTAIQEMKPDSIVVTNYEAVQILPFYRELLSWQPEILIADESQRLKDPAGFRAKKIYPLFDGARRRFILTGTPVLNSLLDIFGQYRALDPSHFGDSFWRFRQLHFYDKNAHMPAYNHFPDWQPKPSAAPEIAKVLAKTSVQAKKLECLDLPPLIRSVVEVPMTGVQAKAYKAMEKEFITELKGVVSVAEFAMTKVLRLQQIAAGFLAADSESRPAYYEEIPRLEATRELLEAIGPKEKVIIWTIFRPTYPLLAEMVGKLGRSCAFLTGDQNITEKEKAITDFCQGDVQVLIANPAAGGVGVNLVEAKYAIYYSRGYSLEQFVQSEARNFRGGSEQHDKVIHYHLMTPGTLDEIIAQALFEKRAVGEALLSWAKKPLVSTSERGTQLVGETT